MNLLPGWQQAILCFCISILALTLLMSFGSDQRVLARTRRDRRPNREVRISYPRTRIQSTSVQRNRPTLQRASTSPTIPTSTTDTATTGSTAESDAASPAPAEPPAGG